MKILIDGRMIGWTGIGRYSIELLDNLQRLDAKNNYIVLVRSADWHKWNPEKSNFSKFKVDIEPYSLAEQTKLPAVIKKHRPDLTHFLSFNSPIMDVGRRITTVHDLTLITHNVARGSLLKRLRYKVKSWIAKWQLKEVLKRSDAIITDTNYGRQRLVSRGLAEAAKISPVYLGASYHLKQPRAPKENPPISGEYLFYVGNYFPYKNIPVLIQAMPEIIKKRPNIKLVLAGKMGEFQDQITRAIQDGGVSDAIVIKGFVSDEELANLYRHAALFVFPSLSEGFGLPGLEAMSFGVPVVASNYTCLPEVLGEGATYFNPDSPSNIADVITEILNDPARRANLKSRGSLQVKKYSWEAMAEKTLQIYRKVLSQ